MDTEMKKIHKGLRKLEAKASKNNLAAVRINRYAKKYDQLLSCLERRAKELNPTGIS